MIRKLFANWRFRTSLPSFEVGERLKVFLTAYDPASARGQARIGDTILEVEGVSAEQVDTLVEMTVDSFDTQTRRGTASADR